MPESRIVTPSPIGAGEAQADVSAAALAKPCRIFVSYAHEDAKDEIDRADVRPRGLLGRFELGLKFLLESRLAGIPGAPRLDEVFIDLNRLNAEPAWSSAIESALNQCELFIYLVSPASLGSSFCLNQELKPVLARQIPATTILLRPVPEKWYETEVGGVTLGSLHSGGLPKAHGNAKAITLWDNRDEAWSRVSDDVEALIRSVFKLQAPPVPVRRGAEPAIAWMPPVPFLCNQDPVVTPFAAALDSWVRSPVHSPLAVLVQGTTEDGLSGFVDRLRVRELGPRLRKWQCGPAIRGRHMIWPRAVASEERFDGLSAARALFKAIDEQFLEPELADCDRLEHAAEQLRHYLHRQHEPFDADHARAEPAALIVGPGRERRHRMATLEPLLA
jgi:hypothetical protein